MAIIELGLLIVLLYVCRGQYKKKKRQQALARNMHAPNWPHSYEIPITVDPFPLPNPPESIAVISRQNSWKRHPYAASTEDEHEMEHTEDVLSAQEYDMRRGNFWGDSLYELVRPRSVGINPGNAVTHSNRDSEDPLVHRQYQPKAEQIPHGVSIPRAHHSSIITPSRAYLPFSGWRHIPETASSPSAYPATLSVEADDEVDGESDHRLPTPTSITRPTAAAFPNQSYSWDASANESRSYRVFVEPDTRTIIPSDPGSDRGSRTASWQYPPSDGTRHSSPPPIPSRNPFRRVTWTRTTPNVSPLISPPLEHMLMIGRRL